jgi:hypothetical protein
MAGKTGSGRAGAERHRGWQCRSRGVHGGGRIEHPPACVPEQGDEVAAATDDGREEFPPQWVARHDPEVTTDIGDDGVDQAGVVLGRDVAGRGRTGDTWFGRAGAAMLATGWGVQGGRRGLFADEAGGSLAASSAAAR